MSLEDTFWNLFNVQQEFGLDFPIQMGGETAGIAEAWARGVSWKELCEMTSLDQGDICKVFRRAVEFLHQIPNAEDVDPVLASRAYEAAMLLNRFPVADTLDNEHYTPTSVIDTANTNVSSENNLSVEIETEEEEEESEYLDEEDVEMTEDELLEFDITDEESVSVSNPDEFSKILAASTKEKKGFQLNISNMQSIEELQQYLHSLAMQTKKQQQEKIVIPKEKKEKKVALAKKEQKDNVPKKLSQKNKSEEKIKTSSSKNSTSKKAK